MAEEVPHEYWVGRPRNKAPGSVPQLMELPGPQPCRGARALVSAPQSRGIEATADSADEHVVIRRDESRWSFCGLSTTEMPATSYGATEHGGRALSIDHHPPREGIERAGVFRHRARNVRFFTDTEFTVRPSMKFLLPTVAASLLLAACGGSSPSSSVSTSTRSAAAVSVPAGSTVLVKTASNSKLGATVLVNSSGMTLYHLSGEHGGKFICSSAQCVQTWPPLTIKSGTTPKGAVASLGTVRRPDGTEQVTYKGTPLYTFAHDNAAGQTNGQGIKDVGTWSAVTTSPGKSTNPAPPAATSTSSSGGGYGY